MNCEHCAQCKQRREERGIPYQARMFEEHPDLLALDIQLTLMYETPGTE